MRKLCQVLKFTAVLAVVASSYDARAQITQCIETNGVKYVQPPRIDGGWDVLDRGQICLGDDFPCTNTGPISDIHIWGSWLSDSVGVITNFWIGIYNDIPVSPVNPFSHPGTNLLWSQLFGPADFSASPYATGSEQFYDPSMTNILGAAPPTWYYCFYPTNLFVQQGTATQPTNY